MREHALLVHVISGIVTTHVYAFDVLLLDALADLLTIEVAAALTTNRRSLTSATRRKLRRRADSIDKGLTQNIVRVKVVVIERIGSAAAVVGATAYGTRSADLQGARSL